MVRARPRHRADRSSKFVFAPGQSSALARVSIRPDNRPRPISSCMARKVSSGGRSMTAMTCAEMSRQAWTAAARSNTGNASSGVAFGAVCVMSLHWDWQASSTGAAIGLAKLCRKGGPIAASVCMLFSGETTARLTRRHVARFMGKFTRRALTGRPVYSWHRFGASYLGLERRDARRP